MSKVGGNVREKWLDSRPSRCYELWDSGIYCATVEKVVKAQAPVGVIGRQGFLGDAWLMTPKPSLALTPVQSAVTYKAEKWGGS